MDVERSLEDIFLFKLSYDAKEYYHFSEVVDEFCKNGWAILNQMF